MKTYRINFEESIILCEDLQCIYPLGFKSHHNLISPDLDDCHTPNKPQKRKILETNNKDSHFLSNSKKTKNCVDDEHVLNHIHNGEEYDKTSSNLQPSHQQTSIKTVDNFEQNEILEADTVDMAVDEDFPAVNESGTGGMTSQNEGCTSQLERPLESTASAQTSFVQWENAYALCWLDCILSALVHLEVLKKTVMDLNSKEESVFHRLFTKYKEANKLYSSRPGRSKDGEYKKLNPEVIRKIETSLNEIRSDIFIRLQPQLRCTLGDMESPVFAFPLLLKIEPQVEKLFKYSFSWNFECSQCGYKYKNRCTKNLVTFTNIIPEWHPLNALHLGPCNYCKSKLQKRKMVLEKVSSIFMLHFVEGLPHNDLQCYSFHLEGCLYQITTVIQYRANNHFITWILDADGSWLECDDLKGPCSKKHEKFEVPASEIHIVIWERKTTQMTDKTTICHPLINTNDQYALGGEKQVSPSVNFVSHTTSAKISSGIHTTDISIAPSTLSQDATKAPGHDTVSLMLEEKKVISKDFLLKNKPVTEDKSVVKPDTFSSHESVRPSVSAPCKEKLTQDEYVAFRFPSPVINANAQSVQLSTKHTVNASTVKAVDDTHPIQGSTEQHTVSGSMVQTVHIADPIQGSTERTVNVSTVRTFHAASPIQEVKSVEVEGVAAPEKDASLRQFLSPKIQTLNPVHSPSLEANLKKKETRASSQTLTAKLLRNPSLKENQKKPFVGSWVQGLLSRGVSFMPPCVSAHNRNNVTDLQPSVKGACNFGGFKTKGKSQKASRESKKFNRGASKSVGDTASQLHANVNVGAELLKKYGTASSRSQLNHGSRENKNDVSRENSVSATNHRDSVEAQIHKLRLKLLKKLKAKKKKLAALTSSPRNETFSSGSLEGSQGSPNECESIEDLLKELQYQIDTADNKSECTTVSGVSPYSSQTHEEILAELLSPTTVVSTELSGKEEADFRYLEMGDNHIPAPVASELNSNLQDTPSTQDHNYCSPSKKNQCRVQPDSLSVESSLKTDIFDEFFSTSTFNNLANDTLDLPHFDEYLFESC